MTNIQQRMKIRVSNPCDAGVQPLAPQSIVEIEHNLEDSGLFEDAALARMLDEFPLQHIEVATMDATPNPNRTQSQWRQGLVDGLSGAEIIDAVTHGRLWLNIKQLSEHVPVFDELMTELYEQICAQLKVPVPSWRKATMLISSPGAWVYYHADAVPNVLWHIRGNKRIHIYPHDDPAFANPADIENICSGKTSESLTYRSEYEVASQIYDLEKGQALMWPQNSPHRVVNTAGLNVTLLTEHIVSAIRRKVNIQRANGVLRSIGFNPSLDQSPSLMNTAKALLGVSQHALSKCRSALTPATPKVHAIQVDPNCELGYRDLDPKVTRAR